MRLENSLMSSRFFVAGREKKPCIISCEALGNVPLSAGR